MGLRLSKKMRCVGVDRSFKKWTWARDGSGWLGMARDGSGFPRFSHVFSVVSQGRVEDIVTDVCVEVYVSACPKYFQCSPGWPNKAACMAWASQLWWRGLGITTLHLHRGWVLIFGLFEMYFLWIKNMFGSWLGMCFWMFSTSTTCHAGFFSAYRAVVTEYHSESQFQGPKAVCICGRGP